MKKSLLALALVAGFAQANETTLYGRVTGEAGVVKAAKEGSKATANLGGVVRFGIKGNEDLNAGLKAIYQMEFNYNFGDDKARGQLSEIRQGYVGLKGDFGTLKLGKQSTVHGLFTGKADYSNSYGAFFNQGHNRLAKAISYATPDMGGVTVAGAIVLDGAGKVVSEADSKAVRAYEVGVQYAANGLEAAATYAQKDSVAGVKAPKYYGASLAYNADTFGVAFDYERQSSESEHPDTEVVYGEANYYALAGEYKISEQDRVYAGIELVDPTAAGAKSQYFAHLGYQHNLSKRTRTWVEIGGERGSLKDLTKTKGGYKATVGLRHDF